mmetsp:Transcript_5489/g.14472  ORF Transcript_5489/g.14472 Transcript_5489/m.14472 type:complete len:80 (+) Transcript_5489:655-894(+)
MHAIRTPGADAPASAAYSRMRIAPETSILFVIEESNIFEGGFSLRMHLCESCEIFKIARTIECVQQKVNTTRGVFIQNL